MLDLDIAYSIIYPQKINYIPVDDFYYQTNYYYKGFGDTLLDALDGSFCTVYSSVLYDIIIKNNDLITEIIVLRFRSKGRQQHC